MAVALDVLTRIVKIVISGAVFVVVINDDVYHIVVDGPGSITSTKLKLPESPKGPIYTVVGTSYKLIGADTDTPRPTFVLCGLVFYEESEVSALASVVLTSNDGEHWRHTFLSKTNPDTDEDLDIHPPFSTANALVWHDHGFYYDQHVSRVVDGSAWIHEQVFHSANGNSWDTEPVMDEVVTANAESAGYRSKFPGKYCSQNNCKDTLSQNVPDGYMHKETDILMRPRTPPTIKYGTPASEFGISNVVEIVTAEGTGHATVGSLSAVACVGGANGIWMAGGASEGSGAAITFDGGMTWEPLDIEGVENYYAFSISAAPLKDIRSD